MMQTSNSYFAEENTETQRLGNLPTVTENQDGEPEFERSQSSSTSVAPHCFSSTASLLSAAVSRDLKDNTREMLAQGPANSTHIQ